MGITSSKSHVDGFESIRRRVDKALDETGVSLPRQAPFDRFVAKLLVHDIGDGIGTDIMWSMEDEVREKALHHAREFLTELVRGINEGIEKSPKDVRAKDVGISVKSLLAELLTENL